MHHRIHEVAFRATPILAALLALSCISDGGKGDGDSTVKKYLHGRFLVNLVEATSLSDAYTSILGRVNDGPTPSTLAWDTSTTIGVCRLLIPRSPFCDPGCGSAASCVEDGVCRAYPAGVNVGTVTMTGVGAASFQMEPVLYNYQPPVGTALGFPPFAEGESVTISAASDSIGSYSLTAKGILPLQTLFDSVILADNQPVTLQWTPPLATGNSTVSARLDISHHGGVKGVIECEGPDKGSMTVAATLVDELKALGISGFPTVEVTRHSSSPARTDMSLELRIESTVTRPISIPGIVSCVGDEDCPSGKTCQQDLKCQ
jgi:hypothetical protein